MSEPIKDVAITFAAAFSSEAGKKVLAIQRENYLDEPAWLPGQDPSMGYFREGQNDVIRKILDAVEDGLNRSK